MIVDDLMQFGIFRFSGEKNVLSSSTLKFHWFFKKVKNAYEIDQLWHYKCSCNITTNFFV